MVRSTDLTTTSVTFSTVFLVRTAHLNKRMVYNVCIMHLMGVLLWSKFSESGDYIQLKGCINVLTFRLACVLNEL